MTVRIPHSCDRDQDGNTLYNSSGEKDRYGSIGVRLIREIMDHLVTKGLFTVHVAQTSCRIDTYGGSLDTSSDTVNSGSPVCVVYNLQHSGLSAAGVFNVYASVIFCMHSCTPSHTTIVQSRRYCRVPRVGPGARDLYTLVAGGSCIRAISSLRRRLCQCISTPCHELLHNDLRHLYGRPLLSLVYDHLHTATYCV